MFFGQRALTPLTSTVFLIVFSLALGIGLMLWGQGYVEKIVAQEPGASVQTDTGYILDVQFKKIDDKYCVSDTGFQQLKEKTAACR